MHRIFIALEVSQTVVKKLISSEKKIESKLDLKINWQSPEDLHITLVPPWYADDSGVAEVAKIIDQFHGQSFEVCLNKICFGPDGKTPFLIWTEVKPDKKLTDLKNQLERALNSKVDERDFLPHITLAWLKDGAGLIDKTAVLNEELGLCYEAEAILLMESVKSGPNKYDVLQRIEL